MTSVAPYPPPSSPPPDYVEHPQSTQRPSIGPYEYPSDFGQSASVGPHQYPPSASYPPGHYGNPPLPSQQQQQQRVVIVNAGATVVPFMSFAKHKYLALISFCFGGVIFGLIGYTLAVYAETLADSGDFSTARTMGQASIAVSIIGILIFIVIVAVVTGA